MIRYLVAIALFVSAPFAYGARCTYNMRLNTIQCCEEGEQAIYNPLTSGIECRASVSLESCLFHPYLNQVTCCEENQEAIWHKQLNSMICCDQSSDGAGPLGGQCNNQ